MLSPFELYTYLFEVANLVNSRPIGRVPNDPDDGTCTSVQTTYCLVVQRPKFHKDRLDKPKTQDTELNLFKNWWTHFGESGAETFSRHWS